MVTDFHPILCGEDQYAERDFYALFGFTTIYEGPEFPGFLAVSAGNATIGLSHRDDLPVDDAARGLRWQFIVENVDDVIASVPPTTCRAKSSSKRAARRIGRRSPKSRLQTAYRCGSRDITMRRHRG